MLSSVHSVYFLPFFSIPFLFFFHLFRPWKWPSEPAKGFGGGLLAPSVGRTTFAEPWPPGPAHTSDSCLMLDYVRVMNFLLLLLIIIINTSFWCIWSPENVSGGCKRRPVPVKRNIKLKQMWLCLNALKSPCSRLCEFLVIMFRMQNTPLVTPLLVWGGLIDWARLTFHQTHYRSYRGRFLQVIWPNQQRQSTERNQLVLQIRLESHQHNSTVLQ